MSSSACYGLKVVYRQLEDPPLNSFGSIVVGAPYCRQPLHEADKIGFATVFGISNTTSIVEMSILTRVFVRNLTTS